MKEKNISDEIRGILIKHGKSEHVNYYDQLFMLLDGETFNRLMLRRKRIKSIDKFINFMRERY